MDFQNPLLFKPEIRLAQKDDLLKLDQFIKSASYFHRHLDWHQPGEWLGEMPFWLIVSRNRILSLLAIPEDPPGVAWVQMFGHDRLHGLRDAWSELLAKCLEHFAGQEVQIAAIGLSEWFTELLIEFGFKYYQSIVVLEHNSQPAPLEKRDGVVIRPATMEDLPHLLKIDNEVFEPLWRLSADGLEHAFQESAYTSVAVYDRSIIGYQLSTTSTFGGHLARLAVIKDMQGRGVGEFLVEEMLHNFWDQGIHQVSVNTQHDNLKSLRVYQKTQFTSTNESFPIFVWQAK